MYKLSLNSRFIKDSVRFIDNYKLNIISGEKYKILKKGELYKLSYKDITTDYITLQELKDFIKECKYYGDEI